MVEGFAAVAAHWCCWITHVDPLLAAWYWEYDCAVYSVTGYTNEWEGCLEATVAWLQLNESNNKLQVFNWCVVKRSSLTGMHSWYLNVVQTVVCLQDCYTHTHGLDARQNVTRDIEWRVFSLKQLASELLKHWRAFTCVAECIHNTWVHSR
jgi:hypothetical protein